MTLKDFGTIAVPDLPGWRLRPVASGGGDTNSILATGPQSACASIAIYAGADTGHLRRRVDHAARLRLSAHGTPEHEHGPFGEEHVTREKGDVLRIFAATGPQWVLRVSLRGRAERALVDALAARLMASHCVVELPSGLRSAELVPVAKELPVR